MDFKTKVSELYKQVQKSHDHMYDIKTYEKSDSNDTEHLIVEEVHWFFKFCRKFFCYV